MANRKKEQEGLNVPLYCIVGQRPVKSIKGANGGVGIYAFNWETKKFDIHPEYLSRIYFGSQDDIEIVSKEDFEKYVKSLK